MRAFPGIVGLFAVALAAAQAAPPAVTLREFASGLAQPVAIGHAGDGSGRLFVLEKAGAIRIVRDGQVAARPFLDITPQVASSGERGLLGIAFHPQYAANRRFFVFYTMAPDDGTGGALRVSSFLASATDPDAADPASEREVITIPHPVFPNHNGGQIAFGPDGFLYVGTGDGGSGGDPDNHAQDLGSLLGKLLRLDVSPAAGYSIPPGNPFVGVAGARGEIWAYGLRNPWRFSFDRATADLYIGDVGQGAIEEVDFVPAGAAAGRNFGWRVFEGLSCYDAARGCELANHAPPILQYLHEPSGGSSITGGHVYRGARSAAMRGYYIYGDFGSSRVWAARREAGLWITAVLIEPPSAISGLSTFGEDEAGEIYVASMFSGKLHVIEGPAQQAPADNVALAANGGVATASGTSAGFSVAALIDGERRGAGFGSGGGWTDDTRDAWPDAVQVAFAGPRTIDRVVVYTVQDNFAVPLEPTDAMTFSMYGVTDFTVEGWSGAAWVPLANVAGNTLVKRTVRFAPFSTDRIRVTLARGLLHYSRLVEVEAWLAADAPAPASPGNFAAASAGATATASSEAAGFPVGSVIDGDRRGVGWGSGGGWNDATRASWPDWVEIDFHATRNIDRVVVYTLQDNFTAPVEPVDTLTFAGYGIVDFTVEAWDGVAWTTVAVVAGNDLVKRTVTFAPLDASRLRVTVTRSLVNYSRIVEVEAFGPALANVALASAGAVALASSTNAAFRVAALNDGERAGAAWLAGGGWVDDTRDAFPDWVEIDLGATRTVQRAVVYSLQDDYLSPVEPTDALGFTQYGVADFNVEGWSGGAWVTLGVVAGNDRVRRAVDFPPFATNRLRVNVTRALLHYSRITEVEAWGR